MSEKVATKKRTSKRPASAGTTTAPLSPLTMRRLAAVLSRVRETGEPADAEPSITAAMHLDAHAAEAAEAVDGWAARWAADQELAERVAAALLAPPTPAAVIHAQRLDWEGDGGRRPAAPIDFASRSARILARRRDDRGRGL